MNSQSNITICNYCKNEVTKSDNFCANCGTIFLENEICENHPNKIAEGKCLICLIKLCTECGLFVNGVFLCEDHSDYEVYEGMSKVFGSSDILQVNYMKEIFEGEGLHPFIYERKTSPLSLGGVDYSLFRASGEYLGHVINESKLLLPLNEVLQGEQIIKDLD
ncbi:MAG: hypothetical protein KAI45_12980 [Melioribacteraceae bacterium]|nr:hypothetical protein [Melioribacteraceae bacterium]